MVSLSSLRCVVHICMSSLLSIGMRQSLYDIPFAGYLQKGVPRVNGVLNRSSRPRTNPRFRDFSYTSDSTSCLYLIRSSSQSKLRIVDGPTTRGVICAPVGTFGEVARRLRRSGTPQGLEVRSNGEKSRADDDDRAIVNATTTSMTTGPARRRRLIVTEGEERDGLEPVSWQWMRCGMALLLF